MRKGKYVDETHYVNDSKLKLVVTGGFEPPIPQHYRIANIRYTFLCFHLPCQKYTI